MSFVCDLHAMVTRTAIIWSISEKPVRYFLITSIVFVNERIRPCLFHAVHLSCCCKCASFLLSLIFTLPATCFLYCLALATLLYFADRNPLFILAAAGTSLVLGACARLPFTFSSTFSFWKLNVRSTIYFPKCTNFCLLVHRTNHFHAGIWTLSKTIEMYLLYFWPMLQCVLTAIRPMFDEWGLLLIVFHFLIKWLILFFRTTFHAGFKLAVANEKTMNRQVHIVMGTMLPICLQHAIALSSSFDDLIHVRFPAQPVSSNAGIERNVRYAVTFPYCRSRDCCC